MKIGIIREGKTPPDSRVPLTPEQCKSLIDSSSVVLVVQSSPGRCFTDDEYRAAGVSVVEDVQDCDVLLGVKEVPIDQLIDGKTYFFFSHTIKEQPYNKGLLKTILAKKIRLVDYEVLTNDKGQRLIAFGVFAGMVGAHNGVMTYGRRGNRFELDRMNSFFDYKAAVEAYGKINFPKMKIVVTGTGRVASGAVKVLDDMGFEQVKPETYLNDDFEGPVYTQLGCKDYVARKDGATFEIEDFYKNPQDYKSIFQPYYSVSNVMINGIYWDNNAPAFFTKEQMKSPDFKIKTIADVTCDIAPVASIPSTLKATTIADPVFGYDPKTESEKAPYHEGVIDMMTIDNLPNELPRDASVSFGQQFMEEIFPELINLEKSEIIKRATIAVDGELGDHFNYLENYVY